MPAVDRDLLLTERRVLREKVQKCSQMNTESAVGATSLIGNAWRGTCPDGLMARGAMEGLLDIAPRARASGHDTAYQRVTLSRKDDA